MGEKSYKIRVSKTLKFTESYTDEGRFMGGGVSIDILKVEDETWVQLTEDLVVDPDDEQPKPTGRVQLHIGWTRVALEEFATFLLALSRYKPPETGYSISFDLVDKDEKPTLNLIVHLPVDNIEERQIYNQLVNSYTGIVDETGEVTDTTLPPIKDKKNR